MYLRENPVLQRELLVNLRSNRAFLLLAVYQVLLASVVMIAWPVDDTVGHSLASSSSSSARNLVNLFFVGQYVIASLMAPTFAAGAISGEKERQTYEMLLASPLRPGAIVVGKMVASLTHLGMLILASLPIIMLCLPLGGVHPSEVLAAYLGLIISVILFGAVGVFCSSYFQRTASALVVSYLVILPMVLLAVLFWSTLESVGQQRLQIAVTVLPAFGITAVILLCAAAAGRMLYPPDVGSGGRDVVDLATEAEQAVGLVIQPDQFPDSLFAPPRKNALMADGANPVYDKEIHGEIFSSGTLMLRLVIQISMALAIPMMGVFLFWQLDRAAWFGVYVMVFSILVGPVFLAGSMTSERERQTLDLLLTTTLSPWQILSGKFVVGFRVSSVLTSFLLFPLLLAAILNSTFWSNWVFVIGMFVIIAVVCLVNSVIAIAFSLFQKKTSVALMATYATLLVLYVGPPAVVSLLRIIGVKEPLLVRFETLSVTSPFSAIFALPRNELLSRTPETAAAFAGNLWLLGGYLLTSGLLVAVVTGAMILRLRSRRGLAE